MTSEQQVALVDAIRHLAIEGEKHGLRANNTAFQQMWPVITASDAYKSIYDDQIRYFKDYLETLGVELDDNALRVVEIGLVTGWSYGILTGIQVERSRDK